MQELETQRLRLIPFTLELKTVTLAERVGSIRVLEKVGMRRLAAEGHTLKWELQK